MDLYLISSTGGTNLAVTGLVLFLLKFFTVVFVIAAIAGISVWIKNILTNRNIDTGKEKIKETLLKTKETVQTKLEEDSILRFVAGVTVTTITTLVVIAFYNVLFKPGYGVTLTLGTSYGATAFLSVLISILISILVLTLIVAVVVLIKKGIIESKANKQKNENTIESLKSI